MILCCFEFYRTTIVSTFCQTVIFLNTCLTLMRRHRKTSISCRPLPGGRTAASQRLHYRCPAAALPLPGGRQHFYDLERMQGRKQQKMRCKCSAFLSYYQ